MDRKRKVYAPFSQTSEAGVTQTPVEGYIDVNQTIYPTVSTGVVNEKGQWAGVKSNDDEFKGLQKEIQVANSTTMVIFGTEENHIDMNGFDILQLGCKASATGNISVVACLGHDTIGFQNLTPVIANDPIKIVDATGSGVETAVNATVTLNAADAWAIISIAQHRLTGFGPMSFKITNQTGSTADFEFAYRRLVL